MLVDVFCIVTIHLNTAFARNNFFLILRVKSKGQGYWRHSDPVPPGPILLTGATWRRVSKDCSSKTGDFIKKCLLLNRVILSTESQYQSLVKCLSLGSREFRYFDVASLDETRYGEWLKFVVLEVCVACSCDLLGTVFVVSF